MRRMSFNFKTGRENRWQDESCEIILSQYTKYMFGKEKKARISFVTWNKRPVTRSHTLDSGQLNQNARWKKIDRLQSQHTSNDKIRLHRN